MIDADCNDGQVCNGVENCHPIFHTCNPGTNAPGGTACGSSANTDCTNPDTCDGNGTCSPNHADNLTPCGNPADTDCSNPDSCNGSGTCLPRNEPNGTACTPDSNQCTDDTCQAGVCTHPNDNTNTCSDGLFCTNPDACSSGVCSGPARDCGQQFCKESTDQCVDCLINAHCDDGVFCNGPATCQAGSFLCRGTCVGGPNNGLACAGPGNCPGGTCGAMVCTGGPFAGNSCAGDQDCSTPETCVPGDEPCLEGEFCNESADACVPLYEPGSWSCPPGAPGSCGFADISRVVDALASGATGAGADLDTLRGPMRGVYLHSGEFTEQAVDLYVPGRSSIADGNDRFHALMTGVCDGNDAFRQGAGVADGNDRFHARAGVCDGNDAFHALFLAGRALSLVSDTADGLFRAPPAASSGSIPWVFGIHDRTHALVGAVGTAGGLLRPPPWANGGSFAGQTYEIPAELGASGGGNSFGDTLAVVQGVRPTQNPFLFARKYRSRVGPTTAMGNGWDFSYNIYIEAAGADRVVHDGWTRADVYEAENLAASHEGNGETSKHQNGETAKQEAPAGAPLAGLGPHPDHLPGGEGGAALAGNPTWTKREFFRKLEQNGNGTYTLTFSDRGKWNFHPLDSGPVAVRGKISTAVDRNNNTTTFAYDAWGWLTSVTDPLGRSLTITYHAGPLSDYIESVCDFTGRCVTYAHYDGVESGGNFGDLKSVTSPAVTGTPTGNDFPQGKTVTYKYSTGNADENLNHNLTEIVDAKGQTFIVNSYASTTNPANTNYDHIESQRWGSAGQTSHVTYAAQTPSAGNGFATVKAIVNDRVGNVSEHFYDAGNRLVRLHEYTGRATPGTPTTDVANRPTSPLRPGEPAYFETQLEWNIDSLPTRVVYPNDNEVTRTFDTNDADPLHRGDMTQRCALAGPLGGDQTQNCESFEYNTSFGGAGYQMDVPCIVELGDVLPLWSQPRAGFAWDLNNDGLYVGAGTRFVTKYTDPRGHDTIMSYGAEGNLTQITHRIPTIVEEFRYNPFGQLRRHIHPDNGSGHRRVDRFDYYGPGDGVQNGYLKNVVIDALHDDQNDPPGTGNELVLTAGFTYDARGNMLGATDFKGKDTQFVRNSLNQVVRSRSRELTGAIRYEWDWFYDANNNLVRVDVQNKNETGALQANSHFTTVIEREILNRPTKVCRESGSHTGSIPGTVNLPLCTGLPDAQFVRNEYQYDANRNVTLVRSGEAVEGRQPNNTVGLTYDERDLLFRVARAPGDTAQSTAQVDYDGNGNIKRLKGGLEDVPGVRTSDFTYDGFNRLMSATDPMGNVRQYHYDPNGNLGGFANAAETTPNPFAVRISGQLTDVEGSAGNLRLAEVMWEWDEGNRPTRREVAFFNPANQTDIGDGESATTFVWSDSSQIESVTDDNLNVTAYSYDTAERLKVVTDAKTNTVTYGYDANSKVISVTELDLSDLGNPPQGQSFTTTHAYDGLDRRISRADNVGNAHQYAYDSRGNLISILLPSLRETRHEYDGLNRRTQTCRDMGGNGANCIVDVDDIACFQSWDDSSRRISRTDDNGNTTRYAYDALDRRIVTQMADGTIDQVGTGATWALGNSSPNLGGFANGYDVHDNAVTRRDANGTVVQSPFDRNDRLTGRTITPGAGVSNDTVSETYQYDGVGRVVSAQDNDSLVTFAYDSMSNVFQEVQNGESVISNWDGWNNQLSCEYPGGRVVTTTYDELNRKDTIAAPTTIARYDYIGPDRVERRRQNAPPNDTAVEYTYDGISNDPGDFGVKRVKRTKHLKITGGAVLDERTYTWDRVYNKTQRKDVRAGGPGLTHDYEYDDADRLDFTDVRNTVNAVVRQTDYELDGVGNRLNVSGEPDPGNYVMATTLPEPADFQTNQYTSTPFDDREYDDNGNLTVIQPGAGTLIAPLTGDNTCQTTNADLGTPCNVPGDCAVPGSTCGLKSRYISITPANGGTATSIKVRVITSPQFPAAVGTEYYAGPEQSIPNPPNAALRGAPLQCTVTPNSQIWTTGVLHLFGPGVVPSTLSPTTYGVSHCDSTGRNCSAELVVQMAKWADVIRPFSPLGNQPNFADINGIVQKFSNLATAPSMPRADLVGTGGPGTPNTPNQIANFSDVSSAVSAFGGVPYPYAGPPSCAGIGPLGPSLITYDYRNQMVRYVDPSGVETQYRYDALGRRIEKIVDVTGTPQTTRFVYDGWRVVEETDELNNTEATYVYGNGIDEVLNMQRMGVNSYYHEDDLGNIMAITNAAGAVVERYDYYDFGGPIFLNANGNPTGASASTIGNPYLFTGREYDPETGLYYYRTRYLDPAAGRFMSRDTIGIWGDSSNFGNGLTYMANAPFAVGLDSLSHEKCTDVSSSETEERETRELRTGTPRVDVPHQWIWIWRWGCPLRICAGDYPPSGYTAGGGGTICN